MAERNEDGFDDLDDRPFDAAVEDISRATHPLRARGGRRCAALSGLAATTSVRAGTAVQCARRAWHRLSLDRCARRPSPAAAGFREHHLAQCVLSRVCPTYRKPGVGPRPA